MFKKNKKEEVEEVAAPKLTSENMREITALVRKHGNTLKVLEYWNMVRLDNNAIESILDYSEMSEASSEKYYEYKPLKNVSYRGTFTPYVFGAEWMSKWSLWVKSRYEEGDKTVEDLIFRGVYKAQ